MGMRIYENPLSPNCRKVRAVVYELGLEPEYVCLDLFKGEQHRPEIKTLNPNGKVPILVDDDFVLWESNAIINYLANGSKLLPTAPRERADVQRWSDWQLAHLGPAVRKVAFERFVKPLTGQGPADAAVVEQGTAEFRAASSVFDAAIGEREYVAGPLSVADFSLGSMFSMATAVGLDVQPFPRVNAWLQRMTARDSMRRASADAQAAMPK